MSASGRRRQAGTRICLFCCAVPATQTPSEALGAKVWRSTTWNWRGRVLPGFSAANNLLQLFDTNGSSLSKNLNRGIIQTRCWFPSTFLFLPLLCCMCYLLRIECMGGKMCVWECVQGLSLTAWQATKSYVTTPTAEDIGYEKHHEFSSPSACSFLTHSTLKGF